MRKKAEKNIPAGTNVLEKTVFNTEGTELRLTEDAAIYVNTGNCQNQGARPYQEDSFGYSNVVSSDIISSRGLLGVLSDGMGGLNNGRDVSEYVVQSAIGAFESIDPRRAVCEQLKAIIYKTNAAVCRKYASGGVSTAGATAVLAYIFKNRLYWAAVGDSRIYCLRKGIMLRLNEDHDYKNRLFRKYLKGEYELDEIENNPQKDSLVSFIGKEGLSDVDVSIRGFKIKPGDTFVLCSDGIYNGVSDEEMADILTRYNAQAASEKIVEGVVNMHFPGQDNMTVMVIKCSKGM